MFAIWNASSNVAKYDEESSAQKIILSFTSVPTVCMCDGQRGHLRGDRVHRRQVAVDSASSNLFQKGRLLYSPKHNVAKKSRVLSSCSCVLQQLLGTKLVGFGCRETLLECKQHTLLHGAIPALTHFVRCVEIDWMWHNPTENRFNSCHCVKCPTVFKSVKTSELSASRWVRTHFCQHSSVTCP